MRAMASENGADKTNSGFSYTNKLLTATIALLLIFTIVAFLSAPLLMRIYGPADWPPEIRDTAITFARFLLPQIFLFGIFAMLQQVLNARKHFAMPMFAPIANNLVVIAVALALLLSVHDSTAKVLSNTEVVALGLGTTAGLGVQVLLLLPALRRAGFEFHFDFRLKGAGLLKPVRLAIWSIGFVAVNQLSYIAITRLSAGANVEVTELGETSIGFTSFQNAQLIFLLPYAVITVSLVTALFPRMTKAANESDADALRKQLKVGLDGILMTLLPASVVLFLIAPYVCVILFARGASSLSESLATAQLVQVFCFGLIPFSIFYLLLRIFYAKENTSTPFFLNLGLNLIALIGALITYQVLPLQDRVTGLVASLVIAYVITTALTLIVTRRVTRGLGLVHLTKTAAKSLLTSAVVGVVCLISLESIKPEVGLNMAQNLIALAVTLVAATGAVLLVWRLLGFRKLSFFQAN
jgi:putative peptidoglycan lipid II flippase